MPVGPAPALRVSFSRFCGFRRRMVVKIGSHSIGPEVASAPLFFAVDNGSYRS